MHSITYYYSLCILYVWKVYSFELFQLQFFLFCVWYASSQDYNSDGDDTDSISESYDDHENSTHMDYAREEGLENLFPHSSPSRMSQHESRTHRLYDRACTAMSRRCTTV
jgi:hypothetical protein